MTRFLSGRQPEIKVGIISYTENKTVLEVIGNTNISGIVTAGYFYGDGSNLTNINANASVAISTTAPENPNEGDLWYSSLLGRTFVYYNDGDSSQWVDTAPFNQSFEGLLGVGIATEGGTIGFGATILDFRGPGISTITVASGIATVNIVGGGGGASVSISTEAPSNPNEGDLWYSSLLGRTFIYYVDDDSSQWVDASPFNTSTIEKTLTIGTRTEAKVLGIFGTGLEIQLRSGIGTATF